MGIISYTDHSSLTLWQDNRDLSDPKAPYRPISLLSQRRKAFQRTVIWFLQQELELSLQEYGNRSHLGAVNAARNLSPLCCLNLIKRLNDPSVLTRNVSTMEANPMKALVSSPKRSNVGLETALSQLSSNG
jgi:hypothetical protein